MRRILILFLAGIFFQNTHAQDKSELENERKSLQQEIRKIQSLYDETHGETRLGLRQLSLLNRKMELQGKYVRNLGREISYLSDQIARSMVEIRRLGNQLEGLKEEYAKTVVYAYKSQSGYGYLSFLFSAASFNDIVKRLTYLRAYRAFRQQQIADIMETQHRIEEKKEQQEDQIREKDERKKELNQENEVLLAQKKEKNAVVAKLQSREKDLKKQLATKKKRDRELQDAITAVVRRDMVIAKKEKSASPANSPTRSSSTRESTPALATLNSADLALGREFEQNKGKLPWPVDKGVVSIHFGRYDVAGSGLDGDNPGITISAPTGAPVKSVFDGEVRAVVNMGDGMAVMIRHGKYYTTYSHLAKVSVHKGDKVSTGQAIGEVAPDPEHKLGEIEFILMIGMEKTNPEQWLR